MIQFIHVYLNITILYQGDAMQISNLVSQYNNSVANGEPMTGAKGVEKLVSSLNEMSKGMIFEGTVSSVRGNQVKLALSNGQQILARLAGKFSFEQGQSVFFQVKNNDGGTIEIKPYTVDGEGANLTLMDALKAAGLPVDGINLSMVNKMMEEQMPLIDESVESSLFSGESALGKTVEIQGYPFTVVGVVTEKDSYDLVINSMDDYYMYAHDDSQGNVFVPSGTWPVIFGYDEPQNLLLKADSTDTMATVGKAAEEILNSNLNVTDGSDVTYKAQDLQEQAKQIQQLSQSTNMMLIWIAGISLLVGGIGVMNIMLVSVTERTSEIGLKKAIGAGKGAILGQFLTEAVVLTSLGGLVGVLVGVILSKVISMLNGTPTAISPAAAILAVLFSMAIGIIFGMLPSYKAANLNPIDALRHE